MNYLIVAYKSDSSDYCRGCHMASYSSDFEFLNTNDRSKALRFLVDKLNVKLDYNESGFKFTLFIDGKTTDVNDNSGSTDEDLYNYELIYEEDPARLLMAEANEVAKYEKEHAEEIRKENEKKRKEAEAAKAAQEKEANDRREFERLRAKYQGTAAQ